MMKGMFVAGCQATTGRSYWHELLYFVHRVGVGAELCFYWLHYLPIAKKNLLFSQLISILWEKNNCVSFSAPVKYRYRSQGFPGLDSKGLQK